MNPNLTKRAQRLTSRAYRYLLWETYAPVLALGVLFVSLFVIGSAAGLWQRIGDPWRLIALIAAFVFLGRSVIKVRTILKPNLSQARRRVEHDSGLSHRPLDTITDTSALGDENDPSWENHIRQARAQINHARRSKLRPALSLVDKYFLRFIVPCVALLAFMVGAGDNYERLRASLKPGWISGISAKQAKFEAWIDPPEYTGRPPSYFKNKNAIETPEGSEFVARISGVKTPPRLILREGKRTRRITAERLGPKSFEARAIVSNSAEASFRIGSKIEKWQLNVGEDMVPSITFVDAPKAGKRDKLIFTYNLHDDYGVQSLDMAIALKSEPDVKELVSINLPGSNVRSAIKEPGALDMTKHKWAGKQVVGYLVAVDGKGQIGTSMSKEFVVPDKIFVEPLAKAIAEQRQLILTGTQEYATLKPLKDVSIDTLEDQPMFAVDRPDRTIERAPESVQRAALLMEVVTDKPAGVYDDPTVYMGLRNVYRRLQTASAQDELSGIPQDLWQMALRAEFGLLGDALEDMRAAEQALNNAMARRAPQREIDALFDRYNAAVDRYMDELMKKAVEEAKNRDNNGDGESGGEGPDMNSTEIQKLLDAIEEANRMGDTVAARKALAKLAQLLENMKIELAQGGGSGEGPSGEGMSKELKEALEELNELLGEQRQLRDETQSAGRDEIDRESGEPQTPGQGETGQGNPKSGSELAEEQDKLLDLLESLEQGVAGGKPGDETGGNGEEGDEEDGAGGQITEDIAKALEDAKGAMRDSEDALENGQFYRAGRAQSDAIDALRKAGEGLYAEEAKRIEEQNAQETGDDDGADPFGRENDGSGVGDDVEVPEIDERQRAYELLQELRKRSGEQERDKIERDYLERLLERF